MKLGSNGHAKLYKTLTAINRLIPINSNCRCNVFLRAKARFIGLAVAEFLHQYSRWSYQIIFCANGIYQFLNRIIGIQE